jgi:hypothetical protein
MIGPTVFSKAVFHARRKRKIVSHTSKQERRVELQAELLEARNREAGLDALTNAIDTVKRDSDLSAGRALQRQEGMGWGMGVGSLAPNQSLLA